MVWAWNLVCGRFRNFEKGRKFLTFWLPCYIHRCSREAMRGTLLPTFFEGETAFTSTFSWGSKILALLWYSRKISNALIVASFHGTSLCLHFDTTPMTTRPPCFSGDMMYNHNFIEMKMAIAQYAWDHTYSCFESWNTDILTTLANSLVVSIHNFRLDKFFFFLQKDK